MREWISFTHTPAGTIVKVTLHEEGLTVRYSVRAFISEPAIEVAVTEARAGARRSLDTLRRVAA